MKIVEKIGNIIEHTFNDKILAVEPVKEMWVSYNDIGDRLEGYIVPMTYKYRGNKNVFFTIDYEHLHLVSPERALKNATNFYLRKSRKMYKQKSGTEDQEYLSVPVEISNMNPIYNSRGCISSHNVVVKYYISKMFMYGYDNRTAETEKQNAASWIEYMQHNGYRVLGTPKYRDFPQSKSVNVYALCECDKHFGQFPISNGAERAWQFWLKNRKKVSQIKKNQEAMRIINENTK